MRWMVLWFLALCLVLLITAAPVMADNWAPDEIGTAVIIGDNPASVPAVSASSWSLLRTETVALFGTILAPERGHIGVGIDAGPTDGMLRGGLGYVNDDLWGVYVRYRF